MTALILPGQLDVPLRDRLRLAYDFTSLRERSRGVSPTAFYGAVGPGSFGMPSGNAGFQLPPGSFSPQRLTIVCRFRRNDFNSRENHFLTADSYSISQRSFQFRLSGDTVQLIGFVSGSPLTVGGEFSEAYRDVPLTVGVTHDGTTTTILGLHGSNLATLYSGTGIGSPLDVTGAYPGVGVGWANASTAYDTTRSTTHRYLLAWDAALPLNDLREVMRDPGAAFQGRRILYFNVAGGGATTVLTGQALTASVGDIAVVGEANVALSGQSVTVDYGSIVVEGHAAVDLGGQEVAVSLGTITFTAATGTRPYLQLAFDPTPAGVNLPPPPLEINWGHPFARDLYRAFVVVGKELIDLVGGSSQAIDVSGVTSLGDGVYSNSDVDLYPPVQPYPNSASFTAFTSYTPADAGTVNHILWYSSSVTSGNGFGNTSFAIREAHFGVSNTAGQGYAFVSQFGTIAATTDCMAYTSLDPVPGTAVLLTGVSRAAAANELYINGDQVGVSGATQTDSAPNFTYNYVNNVADTAITNQFMRGSTPFLFVFSREFSEEEVLYLNRTYRQLVRSKLLNIVGSAASAVVALSGQAVASAYGTLAPGSISSISSDDVVVYGETSAAISGFGFTGKATLTFTSGAASQVQGSLSVATDTSATFNVTQGNLPYGSIDVTFS